MNSIGENCNELKKQYDACFNNWFAEKFLKGDLEDNSCLPMFRVYQTCVKKAMKEQNIDLKDITEKDYLSDELPPKSQNSDSTQNQQSNDRPKVSTS